MAKKVVIVESSAKARTILRYLGKGYEVKASRGHVRDLPGNEFGVDVEKGFEPTYRTLPGSTRVVGALRKASKTAEEVYLAADPDREGEAIAWHLQHVLKLPDDKVKRVTFNEITRGAVREAFRHPRAIDMDLVNAQQARRILDRIVGYELSPLISKKIVRGLSAGRVQSVALRLIVEREREREAFDSVEYWEIKAILSGPREAQQFEAELKKVDGDKVEISNQARADELVELLKGQAFRVASVKRRTATSRARPPFITSTMQQGASTRLRFTAQQTMRIAQQLYEGIEMGAESTGLITYMRTDSTRVAEQALAACREFIGGQYGDGYVPAKPNYFKSPKRAQAAHEAVRPTDASRRPEDVRGYLSEAQFKLYDLIWRRFVASQMKPALYDVTEVGVEAGPALFQANGRRMTFDGHTRVLPARKDSEDQLLPPLEEGDVLELHELAPSQHFTQPPPRYSEATLVRELEKQGIGRPSTYAPTIATLLRRNYVRRERRAFRPTDLGCVVTDLLVEHFPREMAVSFTSRMEDELDEIEEGKRDWRETLAEFYGQFSGNLARARQSMRSVGTEQVQEEQCPDCGKPLLYRFSRKGDRFIGCSGFPECKHTRNIAGPEGEGPAESGHSCDKCGSPMVIKTGRRGREFLACSAFPKCRNIMGLDREGKPVKLAPRLQTGLACPKCSASMHVPDDGRAAELVCSRCRNHVPFLTVEDALKETEIPTDEPLALCGKCDGPMEVKRSRKGLFLGCAKYPECKGTAPLGKNALPAPQPTHERCEKCDRPLLVRWGQYGRFLACSGFPRCRNSWKLPGRRKPCPAEGCDGQLMKKPVGEGEHLGCTRYPDCDHTEPAPAKKNKKK